MANTTTYIHLHTNINKNKNNDDYTNNHCIEILFLVLVSFSRIERLHWIFVTINLCVVSVCLRFALQYSKLAWNGYTKARRAHSFLAHALWNRWKKKIAFYEIKEKMDWTQKANDKKQQHAYRFIDTPKNIHRIGFYTAIRYHLLSLNVLYFSLYIEFLCTNLYIYYMM